MYYVIVKVARKKQEQAENTFKEKYQDKPIKYFYNSKGYGFEGYNEKHLHKYNNVLNDFNNLSEELESLKNSHNKAIKGIWVVALPPINDVASISVVIKKEDKRNFFICADTLTEKGAGLHFYETSDFEEVKNIFYGFIVNQEIPDVSNWKSEYF